LNQCSNDGHSGISRLRRFLFVCFAAHETTSFCETCCYSSRLVGFLRKRHFLFWLDLEPPPLLTSSSFPSFFSRYQSSRKDQKATKTNNQQRRMMMTNFCWKCSSSPRMSQTLAILYSAGRERALSWVTEGEIRLSLTARGRTRLLLLLLPIDPTATKTKSAAGAGAQKWCRRQRIEGRRVARARAWQSQLREEQPASVCMEAAVWLIKEDSFSGKLSRLHPALVAAVKELRTRKRSPWWFPEKYAHKSQILISDTKIADHKYFQGMLLPTPPPRSPFPL
jgi:hypothetical protein